MKFCRVEVWVRGIPGQTGAEFIRVPWIRGSQEVRLHFQGEEGKGRKRGRKDRGGGREDTENDPASAS